MVKVNKVALSGDDDKRIVKKDGIGTLARGHQSLYWNPLLSKILLNFSHIKCPTVILK